MATVASHSDHAHPHPRAEWTPQVALRYSWYAFLTLLVIPFIFFLYTVWAMDRGLWTGGGGTGTGETRNLWLANRWFIGTVAYIVFIVPASFFLRSRFFRGYWTGNCVAPGNYFKGMLTVWLALEIGGLLSITGCLVTRAFAPCILPALVAFMMFVVLWPSGRAMICNDRGSSDDPEKYEEPR
jgi:hypothetical protein